MTRRSLLLGGLGALLGTVPAATATPAGHRTVPTGDWVTLPGGVEVCATDSTGQAATVPVRWNGGRVTATFAAALTTTPGRTTMAGYGLSVRGAGA